MEEKKPLSKSLRLEMIIAHLSIFAIFLFFIMIAAALVASCGHIRLPDRSRCTVPWSKRVDCFTERDCGIEEVCAFRGRVVGKCTLIDCCEPWRHGPRFLGERDWCNHIE